MMTAQIRFLLVALAAAVMLSGCEPAATPGELTPGGATGSPAASASTQPTAGDGFCGAVTAGNMELVVDLLDDDPKLINTPDRDGWSPLHWAVSTHDKPMVVFLLSKGADVNAKTPKGSTPLHRAALEGFTDLADLLIVKGAQVNAADGEGMTPLHWAAYEGKKDTVVLLLAKGADASIRYHGTYTARRLAASKGHKDIADLLAKATPTTTPATAPAR